MIAVQDSFGQVIIPYSISLSNSIFDLSNELALVFIPFCAAIIRCVVEARAQGSDEGSPAVLAIKTYEKAFYSMLAVMLFFLIPAKNGTVEPSYKTFACGYSGENTAFSPLAEHQPKMAEARENLIKQSALLPIGLGLLNNISVGSSEALSAKLPCSASLKKLEAAQAESFIDIQNEQLISNLKSFSQQCYIKAMNRIGDSIVREDIILSAPYDRQDNYFKGFNTMRAYDGIHEQNQMNSLTFKIKGENYVPTIQDEYKPDGYDEDWGFLPGKTSYLLIPCKSAASDFHALLDIYVTQNMSEEVELKYDTLKVLPSNKNESPYFIQKSDIQETFIQQAFLDSVSGKRLIFSQRPNVKPDYSNKAYLTSSSANFIDAIQETARESDFNAMAIANDFMMSFGLGVEIANNASARLNMYMIIPLIVSVLMCALYIATPILLIVSGYSWPMVFNITFTFLFLAMSNYILNISAIITNIIFILQDSMYGHTGSARVIGEDIYDFVAYSVPITAFGAWAGICMVAGLKIGPFMLTFITSTATSAGKKGSQLIQATASKAVGAATGGARGAVAGSKRQIGN